MRLAIGFVVVIILFSFFPQHGKAQNSPEWVKRITENCPNLSIRDYLVYDNERLNEGTDDASYSQGLTIEDIVEIADWVDRGIPNQTYKDKVIFVYFIKTYEGEGTKLFGDIWTSETTGMWGEVTFKDCHPYPAEGKEGERMMSIVIAGNVDSATVFEAIAHEFAHSMGAVHGFESGPEIPDRDDSVVGVFDAYYWSVIVDISLYDGCRELARYLRDDSKGLRDRCEEIKRIAQISD